MTLIWRGADILVGGRLSVRAPTALRDKNVAPPVEEGQSPGSPEWTPHL